MDVFGGLFNFAMSGGGGLFKSVYTGGTYTGRTYTFEKPQIIVFGWFLHSNGSLPMYAVHVAGGNENTDIPVIVSGANGFAFTPNTIFYLNNTGTKLTIDGLTSTGCWISFGT